ncbi:MAG TPA: DUF1571 domain-containing protein [Gemmataceae bacterium]|jgi:hypothetical protein|nr:DUF1571 domain-containing protein [Gemmataceae bacterium]
MAPLSMRLALLLGISLLSGCGLFGRKDNVARGKDYTKPIRQESKPLELVSTSTRDAPLPDPATMIPPPPTLDVPDIPSAPPRETELVSVPVEPAAAPASGTRAKGGDVRPALATEPAKETNLEALQRIHRRAVAKFNALDGYEARVTRRETVGTKAMPEEVLQTKFRRQPFSLHVKWVGLENQGREMIFVQGKYKNEVQILTGRHEGLLIPSGKRFSFAPTDSQVRSKSRYDVREGGMGLSLDWMGRVLAIMDKDARQAGRLTYVGVKPRREREAGLDAVEEVIPPDWEPLLPRGGRRTTYFDPDPQSPSFGLPILISTVGDNGREVEYYWFDGLKPTRFGDADFDAERLWKR